jgi:hypothetical protein
MSDKMAEQFKRLVAGLEPVDKHRVALAEIVAQAIELVAPVLEQNAITLRSLYGATRAFDGNLGEACPNQETLPWWDKKCIRLGGGLNNIGDSGVEGGTPHASGPIVGTELQLFEDGQLVELNWVGRWAAGDSKDAWLSMVGAEVVDPEKAMLRWNFPEMMLGMGEALVFGAKEEDIGKRIERFGALLAGAGLAFEASAQQLEAAASGH